MCKYNLCIHIYLINLNYTSTILFRNSCILHVIHVPVSFIANIRKRDCRRYMLITVSQRATLYFTKANDKSQRRLKFLLASRFNHLRLSAHHNDILSL